MWAAGREGAKRGNLPDHRVTSQGTPRINAIGPRCVEILPQCQVPSPPALSLPIQTADSDADNEEEIDEAHAPGQPVLGSDLDNIEPPPLPPPICPPPSEEQAGVEIEAYRRDQKALIYKAIPAGIDEIDSFFLQRRWGTLTFDPQCQKGSRF